MAKKKLFPLREIQFKISSEPASTGFIDHYKTFVNPWKTIYQAWVGYLGEIQISQRNRSTRAYPLTSQTFVVIAKSVKLKMLKVVFRNNH